MQTPPFVFSRLGVAIAALLLLSTPARLTARPPVATQRVQSRAVAAALTIGNAFHIPDDSSDLNGTHMRSPEFEIGASTTVTVYNGNQFQGTGNPGNQTGGKLYYKAASATTWLNVALGYDSQNGNNKYWKGTFSTASFGVDDVIQYYLEVDYTDHANTYLYGGDAASQATDTQATASASPFTIRNRPAYIFHSNNRVTNANNVTFTTEAGYVSKDGTAPWITNGALYYTTDGTTPSGSLGVAATNSSSKAVALTYDHESNNSSIAGNSMYWTATVSLPTYTTINYKVSLWNNANSEEKFADYNTNGTNNTTFSFSNGSLGDPVLTVNSVSANYTTTHVFVNEINGDQIPLTVFFNPNVQNVDASTVQVFTNLNRRDYAAQAYTNSYGITTQEGIEPPSGDVVGTDDLHYYKAYSMSAVSGGYQATLAATKTGAYRLTARYKLIGGTNWIYYTSVSSARRDHAIVVSPTQARDIQLYELNTLNVDATGDTAATRSTFADLSNPSRRWNLDYLKNLGCNWLWFQPVHPDGILGRQDYPNTTTPYNVGSPYAVKNFFEIMPLMASSFTPTGTDPASNDPSPVAPTVPGYADSPRGKARAEFHDFVVAADTAGVGIMLDAPFNHTSFDCEFGNNGVNLFSPSSGAGYTSAIEDYEARVYSNTNNYALRASGVSTVAVAPDRTDFGKFTDVHDIYFGTYSALVDTSNDEGNYTNEGDQFYGYFGNGAFPTGDPEWNSVDFTTTANNTTVESNITRNVWQYFASYVPYWLSQTGHVDSNGNLAGNSTNVNLSQRLIEDSRGIDGLRADFGQGLPPQCWEYIINVARSYKWNFVFMTESLDGGQVTYRSNRHFDILNENIVFSFQSATTAQNYRDLFDGRRSAYGQGLILMNSTSHDEETYADPYQALIRYMVAGTIDGVPMIFYGQENGVSQTFGFSHYEENFGKEIPHFKQFNSLVPILTNPNIRAGAALPGFCGSRAGSHVQPCPALCQPLLSQPDR